MYLYCLVCSNYLMGGDGECHDCIVCGWKQPVIKGEENDNEYTDE